MAGTLITNSSPTIVTDTENKKAVRVLLSNDQMPLDVQGTLSFSGLSVGMEVTKLIVSTTAVGLPTTALANRNSIIIFNEDSIDSLFINDNALVTTSGANEGWEILPRSSFSVDITDSIVLYGIADAPINIKILELA
jgi:hypothetical protein